MWRSTWPPDWALRPERFYRYMIPQHNGSRTAENRAGASPAEEPQSDHDAIAQAGALLRRYKSGERIGAADGADDGVIVLAGAVLAVASELRGISNALVDLQGVLERRPARCNPPGESTPA